MSKEYETTSFYLACYLASEGMELLRLDRSIGSSRAYFVFQDSPQRQGLVRSFSFSTSTTVNLQDYIHQIKKMKSALYDGY